MATKTTTQTKRLRMKIGPRDQAFKRRVAAKIKAARKARKVPQREVATKFHLDVPAVSRMEGGHRDLRLTQLHALAVFLGTSPRDLVDVPEDD